MRFRLQPVFKFALAFCAVVLVCTLAAELPGWGKVLAAVLVWRVWLIVRLARMEGGAP